MFEDFPPPPDVIFPDRPIPFDVPPDFPPPPDVIFPDRPFPIDLLPIGNATCAEATPLPAGAESVVTASIVDAPMRLAPCGGVTPFGAGVRFYRAPVAPGQTLEVVAARSSVTPLVRVYPDCSLLMCLTQATSIDGANYVARWTNTTPAPRDAIVAVTWSSTGASEPLTFRVRYRNPARNATCANATPLMPDVAVSGQDLADATTSSPACPEAPGTSNPALWYRVSVPAGQVLTVTSVGDVARAGNLLRLYASCTAFSCLTGPSTSFDGRTSTVRWSNGSPMAREVLVAVSSPFAPTTPAAPFSVTASLSPAPTNLTCDRAVDVADGTTLRAQDPSGASILQPPCPGMTGVPALPVLFYRATVPPGQTLFATATPSMMLPARSTPVLRVVPDCSLTTCLAVSTAVAAGTGTVVWTNPTMTPQRVILTLGANPAASALPSDLAVRIRPPATNASCAMPLRVMDGASLPGENLVEARELVRACSTTGAEGAVLYYTARVGAGQQLVATAARVDGAFFQPLLRLTDACASLTCLGTSTVVSGPMGQTSRLSFTNDGPARDVILMLSSNSSGATGRASLNVSISSPPYTISRIPTACDDLSAGTVVVEAVGDDTGSPSFPLPFAFPHFGERMNAWSVSTNGYLQVWPRAGSSSGALGVTDFPNAGAPPSAIAALWDDLEVRAPGDVRWRAFGTAPRHLTVGWNGIGFCCGTAAGQLNFQVKLFETGVVEYHYCSLAPGNPRAAGSNAAIGMQNSTTTRGVTFALRRAGAADPASAIRFTPTP